MNNYIKMLIRLSHDIHKASYHAEPNCQTTLPPVHKLADVAIVHNSWSWKRQKSNIMIFWWVAVVTSNSTTQQIKDFTAVYFPLPGYKQTVTNSTNSLTSLLIT